MEASTRMDTLVRATGSADADQRNREDFLPIAIPIRAYPGCELVYIGSVGRPENL
jgi:hypothetical protein